MEIHFTVPGEPVAQGSMRAYQGRVIQGSDKGHRERLGNWRTDVRAEAFKAMNTAPPHGGAVHVDATFYYGRPKAHYGTGRNADVLKPSAPSMKVGKHDIDKLARSLLDALTSVVFLDDDQVTSLMVTKNWCPPGQERTAVWITLLSYGSQSHAEVAA